MKVRKAQVCLSMYSTTVPRYQVKYAGMEYASTENASSLSAAMEKGSVILTHAMLRSAIVIICRLSSACSLSLVCLSVTRVYCDKTAAVRIMQFLLKCTPMP